MATGSRALRILPVEPSASIEFQAAGTSFEVLDLETASNMHGFTPVQGSEIMDAARGICKGVFYG